MVVFPVTVFANPYTDHFDALIAELEVRSDTLTNTEDKVEVKQKKTVDKVLASFFKKPSPSLEFDLKLAAKAAKSLAKVFPDEFAPAAEFEAFNLNDLLQQALDDFDSEITADLSEAQDMVDSAPPGKCQDKAQKVLDKVMEQLVLADTAPDLSKLAKALAKAAKTVLKGQSLAEAALECDPGGGGGGGDWYDWYFDMTVDDERISAYEDARIGGPDFIAVTYFSDGRLFVAMNKEAGYPSVNFSVFIGNPASKKSYAILPGGGYTDATGMNFYTIISGTCTITKWPKSFPGRGEATFFFQATGSAETVSVTDGSFSVWIYDPI
jgi:hypothetical protein